jgi:hypothetical protein
MGSLNVAGMKNAYCFSKKKKNPNESEELDDLDDDGNTMFGILRQ